MKKHNYGYYRRVIPGDALALYALFFIICKQSVRESISRCLLQTHTQSYIT